LDIKSWILLIGTMLIVAVICHGFWTAYRARKNDVRMAIETDLPEGDLDDMVLLSGELPNGGARVTPTVGYDALRVQERRPLADDWPDVDDLGFANESNAAIDPLEEALIALDDAVASASETLAPEVEIDEGDFDAGYQPEQATLDLEMEALEERCAARTAAGVEPAPLLTDAQPTPVSQLPPKKQITPDQAATPPRKQFEPPLPEEIEAERVRVEQERIKQEAMERERIKLQAAKEAELQAKIEAQRLQRLETEAREAQARIDAEKRQKARAKARAQHEAKLAAQEAAKSLPEQEQLSLSPEPIVEFPEMTPVRDDRQDNQPRRQQISNTPSVNQAPAEELVVLNVIAKSRPFHGGDVLELFLRNGIKFGDMNIFHRIDPVTKLSQYSIASVTEPGYFDLQSMPGEEFRGLCLFMQLPCSGQATKVFTDMLTVADKLARQLDAEVCDEQFNRLTRQSTEHYRQRVAEFTRRNMSRRA